MVQLRRPRKIDLDYAIAVRKWDVIASLGSKAIPVLGFVALGFFAWKVVEALAGQVTISDIAFGLKADLKSTEGFTRAILLLFGISGVAYGNRQRKLRQKDIERRSVHIRELESKIDPSRTSSHLTRRGTTPPGA